MPSSFARDWPCSVVITYCIFIIPLLLVLRDLVSTTIAKHTLLSSISHLLPMRILLTPSLACCSMLENQFLTSEAVGLFLVHILLRFLFPPPYFQKTVRRSHRTPTEYPWLRDSKLCGGKRKASVRASGFRQRGYVYVYFGNTRCDGTEPLLSRCIPNLQFDAFAI